VLRGSALPVVYNSSRVDRDSLPANARFLETDPNASDTIGDGMSDGAADTNANGRVDLRLLYPAGTSTVFDVSAQPQFLLGMDATSQTALASAGITNLASRALNLGALFAAYGRPVKTDGWYETNKWPRVLFLETDPRPAIRMRTAWTTVGSPLRPRSVRRRLVQPCAAARCTRRIPRRAPTAT
jgi:hypothetical protein